MASSSADHALLLDTSAAIALIVRDHEGHAAVTERVRGSRLGLAGHAIFETFSVLTRLPPPLRLSPSSAHAVIARNFPDSHQLSPDGAEKLFALLAVSRITGGSVFDALVAAAAHEAGASLISRDRRAVRTYDVVGARVEVV
ncbi:type II toxin-antitoxin system VapC family toxin [Microbacterium protaetiae]|uniref:Ribonuclease VapC n=1 Tax=Microbacterium protaetiae TaxID=2509458 RepID=A0A4V0YD98_9MICO|nr:PIN domain-containing protein [Microbacterium protaetiae]QAY59961.1 type II toxin-antitoxin system VapC family toxin [Microbacterium protaetiae]